LLFFGQVRVGDRGRGAEGKNIGGEKTSPGSIGRIVLTKTGWKDIKRPLREKQTYGLFQKESIRSQRREKPTDNRERSPQDSSSGGVTGERQGRFLFGGHSTVIRARKREEARKKSTALGGVREVKRKRLEGLRKTRAGKLELWWIRKKEKNGSKQGKRTEQQERALSGTRYRKEQEEKPSPDIRDLSREKKDLRGKQKKEPRNGLASLDRGRTDRQALLDEHLIRPGGRL